MLPAQQPQPPSEQVRRFAVEIGQILETLPADRRRMVSEFWSRLRDALKASESLVDALRAQLGRHMPRPPTTPAVNNARDAVEAVLSHQSRLARDASNTIEGICELDPVWAREYLDGSHPLTNSTNCWLNGNAAAHPNGYKKINLRNTRRPGSWGSIGVQPFAHQLAVVAAWEGHLLRLTDPRDQTSHHEVSHLCHTPGCFNPEHVLVESEADNKARNSCKGAAVVVTPDGTSIDPCPHWTMERKVSCILPTKHISGLDRGCYLQRQPNGDYLRR
jgi:hypothetical protein